MDEDRDRIAVIIATLERQQGEIQELLNTMKEMLRRVTEDDANRPISSTTLTRPKKPRRPN